MVQVVWSIRSFLKILIRLLTNSGETSFNICQQHLTAIYFIERAKTELELRREPIILITRIVIKTFPDFILVERFLSIICLPFVMFRGGENKVKSVISQNRVFFENVDNFGDRTEITDDEQMNE